MPAIDLNCDMGEGCADDAALMKYVSSANVACGCHAGDRETMKKTVELAVANGVAVGAHPGYSDRPNFGRIPINLPMTRVYDLVTEQINALSEIAHASGTRLNHVKPHGALYNQAARNPELAAVIAAAVSDVDAGLILFGLSASASIEEAARRGLTTASEVFADRSYTEDGALTPRSESNALVSDVNVAVTQVLDLIKYGRVRSTSGIMVKLDAETVCIHGDGPDALSFAKAISLELHKNRIIVRPPHRAA